MEGLTEGRIVHFVLPGRDADGRMGQLALTLKPEAAGKHRPGIVTDRTGDSELAPGGGEGLANLTVFLDGMDGLKVWATPTAWIGSVPYSENHEPGTWHWIERA